MTAPGVVKIRLSGGAEGIAALGALFDRLQASAVAGQVAILTPGGEVVNCPAPEVLDGPDRRPNRREPGYRVYLTVRLASAPPARRGRQDQRASELAQRMTRKRGHQPGGAQ